MKRRTAAWGGVALAGATLAAVLAIVGRRSQAPDVAASARIMLVDEGVATYAYTDAAGRMHLGQDRFDEPVSAEMSIRYDSDLPSASCSERTFWKARQRRWVAWGLAAVSGLVALTAIALGLRARRVG